MTGFPPPYWPCQNEQGMIEVDMDAGSPLPGCRRSFPVEASLRLRGAAVEFLEKFSLDT